MAVTRAPDPGAEDRRRQTVLRVAVLPAWVALGVAVVPFLLDVRVPLAVRYLPFLASLVVFGLPHGAVDHLAVARLGGTRPFVAVGAAYLVGGAAYLGAWTVAPAVGFASFVLLTWYHWGQGDLYVLLAVGDHLRTRGQRLLALVVRGGVPMVVPLVAFPGVYRSVARATVGLFDPEAAASLALVFRPGVRLALGGALAVLSLVALALGHARGEGWRDRGWRADALETGFLWGYFLIVPPVLAVGLYFCLWHSVRHVVRLLVVEGGSSENSGAESSAATLARGRVVPALARFGREAFPNAVGALAFLALLGVALPPRATLQSVLGLYLVALAVLTLPHAAVVTWMDVREGVWSVS